jgi:hypothetical protein
MNATPLQLPQKTWEELPLELRALLSAEETIDLIEKIGVKHGLSGVEQGFLLRITGKLLKGVLPPTAFVKEIEVNIDIPRERAAYIAQEINRDIFNDVKDALKNLYGVGASTSLDMPHEAPIGVAPAPTAKTGPIRSDWGWHGTKNEVTGKIEFKREGGEPETHTSIPVAPTPSVSTYKSQPETLPRPSTLVHELATPEETRAGMPHVGSIFEQKLGGAFSIKSGVAAYTATPAPASTSLSGILGLRVPHKPTEIKIPPVQIDPPAK